MSQPGLLGRFAAPEARGHRPRNPGGFCLLCLFCLPTRLEAAHSTLGGAVFVPMALTPYGRWHKEGKDSAEESWTRRTTHTGDNVGFYEFDQRFEHPGRTWASATHRAFSFACVGAAMANETWKFVQTKSKHAMKQVLGIKNEAARMKVTPPLTVAPHVHGDDMRWNPNDDGINFNP